MVIECSERVGKPTVHRDSRVTRGKNRGHLTIIRSLDITACCPKRSLQEKVFLDYAWARDGLWVEIAVCRFGFHFGSHPIFQVDRIERDPTVEDFPSVAEQLGLQPHNLAAIIRRLAPPRN